MIVLELEREDILKRLYKTKTRIEKNKLGQYSTPNKIAEEIIEFVLLRNAKTISFLEPGFGSGTFYNSLLRKAVPELISFARGYEIDGKYSEFSDLYNKGNFELRIEDFTLAAPEPFDVICCNPPYSRHHHLSIEQKKNLHEQIKNKYGLKLSGLTGLHCYFLLLGEKWLAPNGVSCWLLPSEFLDVKYGIEIKRFLTKSVRLTHLHIFSSAKSQFEDALVSSCIVVYEKGKPLANDQTVISYGNSFLNPDSRISVANTDLIAEKKWTRHFQKSSQIETSVGKQFVLKDFFDIKRGLATGNNSFFILDKALVSKNQIPQELLTPILPSPRNLKSDLILKDKSGNPQNIEPLFLLNCRMEPELLKRQYPSVWEYLSLGIGSVDQKYLCKSRKVWYYQEHREPAPFLCTYMGRNSKNSDVPFRIIKNESLAVATNSYLMLYPKSFLKGKLNEHTLNKIWHSLQSISSLNFTDKGRTYGGGLEKLEPSELSNVSVPDLNEFI